MRNKLLQSTNDITRVVALMVLYQPVVRQTQTDQQHILDMLQNGFD